jgi:hypothetical protein
MNFSSKSASTTSNPSASPRAISTPTPWEKTTSSFSGRVAGGAPRTASIAAAKRARRSPGAADEGRAAQARDGSVECGRAQAGGEEFARSWIRVGRTTRRVLAVRLSSSSPRAPVTSHRAQPPPGSNIRQEGASAATRDCGGVTAAKPRHRGLRGEGFGGGA